MIAGLGFLLALDQGAQGVGASTDGGDGRDEQASIAELRERDGLQV